MLTISSKTPVIAWRECLRQLHAYGTTKDNSKFYRDEVAIIEITAPCIELIPEQFPMSQHNIDIINNYIITGENESAVVHEWTKLYYHRIYDGPNSQYDFLLKTLSQDPQSGRAQIAMWDKNIDQVANIAPCTQIIWARRKHSCLELHVHAASVDAYKKFLMNQQEFITLQLHIAKQLGLGVGKFYHIIDSCHIYAADSEIIKSMG